ncbi:hypothetical protein O6H91_04G050100 [Diphasiastrum complanatum]|uniref:Uncharacterized protein n=1 Tax=Diphasiastrum complanatum TaxID=34168 RepID=A0ACC2DWV8_DIPCM|nr:hypothetical protein O6H91_04G050100 [Diphasiastrum complanatum]
MAMAKAALSRRLRRNSMNGSLLSLLPAAQTPPFATLDNQISLIVESVVQPSSNMPQPSSNNSWQPLFALSRSIFSVSSSLNGPGCRPVDPGAAILRGLGSTEMRVSGANNAICRGFAKAKKSRGEDVIEVSVGSGSPEQAREIASSQMEVAMDAFIVELSKLRTGRASSGMLDHVMVEVHGTKTPLNNVAAVSVFDSQTINVLPFDSFMMKEVERAICSSPLRLTPISEGQTLKVPIPSLQLTYL